MSEKDIFRIQHDNPKGLKRRLFRTYTKLDLSDEWQKSKPTDSRLFDLKFTTLKVLNIIIVILFFIFLSRLFALQIVSGDKYLVRSQGNHIRTQVLEAPRGIFYDSKGKQLVSNEPLFYLAYIPSDLPQEEVLDQQLEYISKITNIDKNELKLVIESNPRVTFKPFPLIDALSYEQVIELKTRLSDWSGLELGTRGSRNYTYKDSVSHVLGYMGRISDKELNNDLYKDYRLTDFVGKSGLELQYEHKLRGVSGKEEVEINVRGQIQKVLNEVAPISGNDIKLALDLDIQNKLYEITKNNLERLKKEKAAVVAMNPSTGEILAVLSFPSYDNNIFSGKVSYNDYQNLINNEDQPLFFRPLQGEYPSGSIFKPVVALAALQEGVITPQTTILSQGGIQIDRWFFPDWKYGGHGISNLTKAIAESVNTYFFAIGGGYGKIDGLGIAKITDFAKKLFFTKILDVDFPSEAKGFLPSKQWKEDVKNERWYIGDTYNVSIGQGDVLVTPLQITSMMSFLANGGVMYKPHFVKEIIYSDGAIEKVEPEILTENIISQEHIAAVREGLKATIEWGSARSLSVYSPFDIAGKTGTAQVGGDLDPHGWFTSFAPYENPTIVLTILVENGVSGSDSAVPIAREFYKWYKEKYYDKN